MPTKDLYTVWVRDVTGRMAHVAKKTGEDSADEAMKMAKALLAAGVSDAGISGPEWRA